MVSVIEFSLANIQLNVSDFPTDNRPEDSKLSTNIRMYRSMEMVVN